MRDYRLMTYYDRNCRLCYIIVKLALARSNYGSHNVPYHRSILVPCRIVSIRLSHHYEISSPSILVTADDVHMHNHLDNHLLYAIKLGDDDLCTFA
jgi:hypothetical protein